MILSLSELHRDLEDIILIRGVDLTSNVYIILGKKIGLVDTGSGPPLNLLSNDFRELGIEINQISRVMLTHSHSDHIGGIKEIISKSNPIINIHPAAIDHIDRDGKVFPLVDGETVQLGQMTLKTIFTRGHSSDSICLYNPFHQILFSGDTLFPFGNIGRTDLPTGNSGQLVKSLGLLSSLNVKHLLPGHEDPVVDEAGRHIKSSLKTAEEFFSGHL